MQELRIVVLSCLLVLNNSFGMEESPAIFSQKPIETLKNAIFLRENDTCKTIIENSPAIVNADIKMWCGGFCKPLHIAVELNNIFATKLLLSLKVPVNQKTTSNHYTPLHMARTKEMIKLLLRHGADLNSVDCRSDTPLYHMLFHRSGYEYSGDKINADQKLDCAHCLIKLGADINQLIDQKRYSLLHYAVLDKNSAAARLLLNNGINLESKDLQGKTALELGAYDWGHHKAVLKEFESKGIIFVKDNDIFELLNDNARKFKEIVHSDSTSFAKAEVENFIANFFMTIRRNSDSNVGDNKIVAYPSKGYFFNNASCKDLEARVGKDAVDYVKKYLNDRCQQALSFAKSGDYKKLNRIVLYCPYVLSYDKQITFELLHFVMINCPEDIFRYLLNNDPDLSGVADIYHCYNTLLHSAIIHKKAYAIKLLIQNNSSLCEWNSCSKLPYVLLHEVNDKECIDAFNDAFADKFFSTYSYQPYYREIKKFLKNRFNVNVCDKNGNSLLLRAVKSHPEKCSLLLKHGAFVTQEIIDAAGSVELRTILQKKYYIQQLIGFIKDNDLDACKKIIEKDPDVVNREYALHLDTLFCYPLHLAVAMDNIEMAQLLLSSKALIDAQTKYEQNIPLHMVRSKEMAQLLLKYGASINSKNSRGQTPLFDLLFSAYFFSKDEWLNAYQRCELANYLIKSGADINKRDSKKGNTVLHQAVSFNERETIDFLLDNNADVHCKNFFSASPLDNAIEGRFGNAIKALKNKGILYVPQHLNIIELLKGTVGYPDKILSSGKKEVEDILAELFMIAARNDGASVGYDKMVVYRGYGYCFKNPSFKDLKRWFDKKVIGYVKRHLNGRCLTALFFALQHNYQELKNIVLNYPYVLFYDKNIAFEILMNALIGADKDFFTWVLKQSPDVSGVHKDTRDTLLHLAIAYKNPLAIELLIKNGISLTCDKNNYHPPMVLFEMIKDQACIDAFNNAFIKKLFSTYSYQPYYQEIKNCLKSGFDVNVCDKNGNSLLLRAVKSHPEKCSLLLKYGALVTQEIIDNASSVRLRMILQKNMKL